ELVRELYVARGDVPHAARRAEPPPSAGGGRRDRGRARRPAAVDPESAPEGRRDDGVDASVHDRGRRPVERIDAPARRRRQPRRQGRQLHDRVAARGVRARPEHAHLRQHRQRVRHRVRDLWRIRRPGRGARRRVRRSALLLAGRTAGGLDRDPRRVLSAAPTDSSVLARRLLPRSIIRFREDVMRDFRSASSPLRAVAAVAFLLLAGCSTVYYEALERFGVEKRDILVDRVEDARDAQNDAKEQFQSALDQYRSVISFDGGNLEEVYDRLNGSYERSVSRAQAVSDRINAVQRVADDLFAEWEAELDEYADAGLR